MILKSTFLTILQLDAFASRRKTSVIRKKKKKREYIRPKSWLLPSFSVSRISWSWRSDSASSTSASSITRVTFDVTLKIAAGTFFLSPLSFSPPFADGKSDAKVGFTLCLPLKLYSPLRKCKIFFLKKAKGQPSHKCNVRRYSRGNVARKIIARTNLHQHCHLTFRYS